ncbi:glycosyl hydrolase [Dysgonomonas termitidis]|uniref:Glycosyl hydrolase n=1 Tax=Dysgonomonas termitidis TaxID=1516126 RepID=A0ABV9L311_9BACT
MKKLIVFLILISYLGVFSNIYINAQERPSGYPQRSGIIDIRSNFANPPKGYGEVPFFWWMGDTLTREHLSWHLDKLDNKHITSLQVNYAHDDKGGITYGKTLPSQPSLFTEEWWNLFGWFENEAGKRGMTVSLSDYTLGVGQGSYVDEMLKEDSSLNGYELCFRSDTLVSEFFYRTFVEMPLLLNAYELDKDYNITGHPVDLIPQITNGKIEWKSKWPNTLITEVFADHRVPSLDPMNPNSGKSYVEHFFQCFEDRLTKSSESGLNFFFSDELQFHLSGWLWNNIFSEEFHKRKGYDINLYLDGLFMDIGDKTPGVRLDYNDVMVSLSEENFFILVYKWHEDRGLLYGCDHGGRGLDVVEFGDYFRTQRWNQAPGCDQPGLGIDIIKNKVASSIAHLYERERVWLEGFHSSGWSTNTEQLTKAVFANYASGQNLLSLHGFYYSTMGGWWEWAPPCNHFHEPYWEEIKPFLECTERLSYILSQGYHCADVAVLYPVEPVIAGYGDGCVKKSFAVGELLYKNGMDFDFMDYESLARSKVDSKNLNIAGESFKVLIIPSMKAIRSSSLEKILEFKRNGGVIINIGDKPQVTERGRNHPKDKKLLEQIFEGGKNTIHCINETESLLSIIDQKFQRDFRVISGTGENETPYVMHRTIDGKDLYAVYNIKKGTECFFRAKGAAHLWNPWTGKITPLSVEKITREGIVLRLPLENSDIQIITFDPSIKPTIEKYAPNEYATKYIPLNGDWQFEIVPLLDNDYGDFSLPAYNDKVGAIIYRASYSFSNKETLNTFTFGTKFMILSAVPEIDIEILKSSIKENLSTIDSHGRNYSWQPYEFSWRWGVEGDYGYQGWHGLKARMYDDFIRLGKKEYTWNANEIVRIQEENGEKNYYLFTRVNAPRSGFYLAEYGKMFPANIYINGQHAESSPELELKQGINEILLHFDSYGVTRFALRDGKPDIIEETLKESPLRMKYRGDKSLLLFDIREEVSNHGEFSFTSAPGLKELFFSSYGKAWVNANNIAAEMIVTGTREDGLIQYTAKLAEPAIRPVNIIINVDEPLGYGGGSVIDSPIKQICTEGIIPIGDWSTIEGLKAYSGGAWYRYNMELEDLPQRKATLNLGQVISTARVRINKKEAGLRLSAPWKFDVSDYLQTGNNLIEVLVCNTAANYYLSVPTRYRGTIESGIIGPVYIEIE